MLGIPAGKAPHLQEWSAVEFLSPPGSNPSLNCQILWKQGREGTSAEVRLQPSTFKHSVT